MVEDTSSFGKAVIRELLVLVCLLLRDGLTVLSSTKRIQPAYQSGYNRSMIDYLMVRKTDRCLVKDVKVISSEECVPQHRMVIGRLVLPMKPQKKKKIVKFVPKPRVWKLKDEETARLFTHEMAARNDEVTKADDIQKKWLLMNETWLKGSKQVCGMTKGPPRHKETWWWNRDVENVVAKLRCVTKPGGNLNRLKIHIL